MKIPSAISITYHTLQKEVYKPLKAYVDKIFQNRDCSWHYVARIKEEESYVQKLETGRCNTPFLEDFFACTLVIENFTRLQEALDFIKKNFNIEYQRPADIGITKKESYAFLFDDLRLYVKLKLKDHQYKIINLSNYIFEIQIKTFLQHAWSMATHDLIYKTDSISWPEERIAYQIKATLEHIDLSLAKEAMQAKELHLKITNEKTENTIKVINLVKKYWSVSSLPKDIKRLAETICNMLKKTGVCIEELSRLIEQEVEQGRGPNLMNLSPYSCVVEILLNYKAEDVITAIERKKLLLFLAKDLIIQGDVFEKISGKVILQEQLEYKE